MHKFLRVVNGCLSVIKGQVERRLQMKKVIDIKSLIIGVLVTALVFTIIGARGKNSANFDTITAKAIRIVDQKGKVVAILASNSEGNRLEIRNGKGKIMADLINVPFLTALTLYSAEEKPVCELVSVFLGELGLYGGLHLYNQHGKKVVTLVSTEAEGGALYINNQHGKEIVMLGSTEDEGGGLFICNQHGKKVATVQSHKAGGGALGIFNQHGKAVAGLVSYEARGGLYLYNQHGKEVATLQSTEGGGGLWINNQHGKEVIQLSPCKAGGGGLWINNQHGKRVITVQSDKDGDGAIALFDRYGDLGWGKIGKK